MMASANTAYFDRTYDETMRLLLEARSYVASARRRPDMRATPTERLAVCCETFRLTSRLTHVMAWLLAQRAVHAGEITVEEAAAEPYSLGGRTTCLDEGFCPEPEEDAWLVGLLNRSRNLYTRVARLDDMVRYRVAAGLACQDERL